MTQQSIQSFKSLHQVALHTVTTFVLIFMTASNSVAETGSRQKGENTGAVIKKQKLEIPESRPLSDFNLHCIADRQGKPEHYYVDTSKKLFGIKESSDSAQLIEVKYFETIEAEKSFVLVANLDFYYNIVYALNVADLKGSLSMQAKDLEKKNHFTDSEVSCELNK